MAGFSVLDILNKNSKTEETIQQDKPQFVRSEVDIGRIMPSKENFYSTNEIEELKTSIEMFGILQELLVKEVEGGNVEIIAGHRRYWASKDLVDEGKEQFRKIPCRIEISLETVKEKLMFLMTNSTIRVLKDWEKVQQAAELKKWLKEYAKYNKLPGRIRNYIAEMLHISPTQAGRLDKINRRLSNQYKEALKDERIGLSTAEELSTLTEQEQQEIYEQAGERTKLCDVKQYKNKKLHVHEVNSYFDNTDDSLGECKKEVDEPNWCTQEQYQEKETDRTESKELAAEPALLVVGGYAKPKERTQEEKPAEPGVLKIEAARFTMRILEREIEKCGIEIRYAEEQGKVAKGALAAAKIEYLGGILSSVQHDLFEMTGDDLFKEV